MGFRILGHWLRLGRDSGRLFDFVLREFASFLSSERKTGGVYGSAYGTHVRYTIVVLRRDCTIY